VYVLGPPEVPKGAVRIYLDVESNPEEGYVYLVGMIVCDSRGETRYSFWADNKNQERNTFEQLVELVARFEEPLVFCYGSYEKVLRTCLVESVGHYDKTATPGAREGDPDSSLNSMPLRNILDSRRRLQLVTTGLSPIHQLDNTTRARQTGKPTSGKPRGMIS
jgi:hypothetical protein